jgi:hypothetical protein
MFEGTERAGGAELMRECETFVRRERTREVMNLYD